MKPVFVSSSVRSEFNRLMDKLEIIFERFQSAVSDWAFDVEAFVIEAFTVHS